MSKEMKIFVRLLNEDVDVWRPVLARHTHDNCYLIVDQAYDEEAETWEFGPGSAVICEPLSTAEGPILAAIRAVE